MSPTPAIAPIPVSPHASVLATGGLRVVVVCRLGGRVGGQGGQGGWAGWAGWVGRVGRVGGQGRREGWAGRVGRARWAGWAGKSTRRGDHRKQHADRRRGGPAPLASHSPRERDTFAPPPTPVAAASLFGAAGTGAGLQEPHAATKQRVEVLSRDPLVPHDGVHRGRHEEGSAHRVRAVRPRDWRGESVVQVVVPRADNLGARGCEEVRGEAASWGCVVVPEGLRIRGGAGARGRGGACKQGGFGGSRAQGGRWCRRHIGGVAGIAGCPRSVRLSCTQASDCRRERRLEPHTTGTRRCGPRARPRRGLWRGLSVAGCCVPSDSVRFPTRGGWGTCPARPRRECWRRAARSAAWVA